MTSQMYSQGYKRYVLATLTTVYMMNYVDRHLLGVMLQSIKEDLQLSDTQLGFLSGIVFALFYATLGIPIARWADRGNRVTITAAAMALWGGMVMLCSQVGNFVQLALVRIGAAVGEAGCMPPTYSLVGDYFHGRAHTRAMSIYIMGGPLSGLVGLVVGGWLNELYGWRMAFLLAGIPGLLLALLVRLTIAEPRRHAHRPLATAPSLPPIGQVFVTLWRQRSFRHLVLAWTFFLVAILGLVPWYAAFLIRSHGMTSGEVGLWLGLIISLGGAAGALLGGYLLDRYLPGKEQTWMRVIAVTILLLVPFLVIFLWVPQKQIALLAFIPAALVSTIFHGPVFALMQRLVVSEMRATALAVTMLVANLIGMGLGPQVVGILSDLWMPALGADSLRLAMLAVSLVLLWAAYHFWVVARTVQADLSVIRLRNEATHSSIADGAFSAEGGRP